MFQINIFDNQNDQSAYIESNIKDLVETCQDCAWCIGKAGCCQTDHVDNIDQKSIEADENQAVGNH